MPRPEVISLVDYDNVCIQRNTTPADVVLNLSEILNNLRHALDAHAFQADELSVRLYGGWIDEKGRYTRVAEWILAELPNQRGLRNGVRMLPRLVTSLAPGPVVSLVGTYRIDSKRPRQKMVDSMLVVDALHFAEAEGQALIMASDDDDFVPVALATSTDAPGSITLLWLRLRNPGDGINDGLLRRNSVVLGKMR